MSTPTAVEQLEQGKKRLEALNTRRQRAQVQLEAGRQQLAEAQNEAMAAYGTADLTELKKILSRQEAENTSALGEFLKSVAEFETFVGRIEEALASPAVMASLLAAMPEPAVMAEPVQGKPVAAKSFASEDI